MNFVHLTRINLVPHLMSQGDVDQKTPSQPLKGLKRRLSRVDDVECRALLKPFIKHNPPKYWDENWSLYWLSVEFGRKESDPRIRYVLEGIKDFAQASRAENQFTLINQACIPFHLVQHLTLNGFKYMPIPIFGIRPEGGIPSLPTQETISRVEGKRVRSLQDIHEDIPSVFLWISCSQDEARSKLSGQGGWSCFFSEHGKDAFFTGIQKRFADKLKSSALKEMPYIAPVMSAATFINSSREQIAAWFYLFTLCVVENVEDKGLIVASRISLDELLIRLVKESKLNTPER